MYYVYVLQSELDQGLYISFSGGLAKRLSNHQKGEVRSTVGRRPLKLIYYEAYLFELDALGREHFLKSGSGRKYLDKQLREYFSINQRR
mgnify:CR=1 FL=1